MLCRIRSNIKFISVQYNGMLKVVTGSFLFIWYVINSMVIQTVMLYFNLWSELKGVPVLMNIQKNVVLSTL